MKGNEKKIKRVKKSPGRLKKHGRRPAAGDAHPGPWRSELWPHLETIRKMRLRRHTWAQVAEAVHQAGGPKLAATTCYNFYKRAVNLSRKGKLPLGFVDPSAGAPEPAPTQPASAPTAPTADKPLSGRAAREQLKARVRDIAQEERQQQLEARKLKLRPQNE
jgi:hypothetical protein